MLHINKHEICLWNIQVMQSVKVRYEVAHDLSWAGMHPVFQQEIPNGLYFSEELVKIEI